MIMDYLQSVNLFNIVGTYPCWRTERQRMGHSLLCITFYQVCVSSVTFYLPLSHPLNCTPLHAECLSHHFYSQVQGFVRFCIF